jgi:hypothetical protein
MDPSLVQVLPKYCPSIAQVLPKSCPSLAQVLSIGSKSLLAKTACRASLTDQMTNCMIRDPNNNNNNNNNNNKAI